ncbi:hypothetical protein AXG93_4334s1000 [Marchantia polymorpha subsp. ruderalis]|uniref:Uncharacterized protein n=1 Tax=Marchantia polymorpha subsp. ruderalis TaxID=1480154 RepID=A0A176WJM7_MARPO|nr:hypothetical protein AXG93_4334s1000 [Marchantia polymorpha subsp. ruderalis]
MLSEVILKQIVAEVGGTVGNITEISEPPPPEEEVRPEVATKTWEEGPKEQDEAQESSCNEEGGDFATAMAKERAASLTAQCAAAITTLKEREDQFREKEIECEVLQLNLAYKAAIQRAERLITTVGKQEQMHVEELAKVEARRAEEAQIAEDLWGKIAEAKTAEEKLCSKNAEIASERDKEFKRAEELTASLAKEFQKHEEESTGWAKKLTDCKSARSSEVECRLKVELEQRRLQE